jgi:hypothetical protein
MGRILSELQFLVTIAIILVAIYLYAAMPAYPPCLFCH